jgi:predicted  nucleic acid-binding Zn-ribbon protein
MNEPTGKTLKRIVELHSLEDILNTFSQQKVKTSEVTAQIEALRAQIPAKMLRQHDHLRLRGKRSVAEVRNGVCSGCHMQLATGVLPALLRGAALQTCDHCGRLLYIAPPSPQPTDAPLVQPPATDAKPAKPAKSRARKKDLVAA